MTGFYSGLYGERNQAIEAIDTTGSYIGWSYSGASNGADRYVQEFTTGCSRTIWKHENLGSVEQVRYNLP